MAWVRALLACASLIGMGGLAGAVRAQEAPLSRNDPAKAVRLPDRPASPLEIQSPAADRSAPNSGDEPKLLVRSVRFEGAHAVSEAQLRPAWAALENKSVSLADLRAAASRVEALYAEAGFPFVAVIVPAQEVKDGLVTLQVVEGRVTDLTVLGLDPVARRQATFAFQSMVERQPLSRAAVEAAYERAQLVPGLAVAGALRRGSKPGGMDLVVQARREIWRAYVNVNNLYSNAVGPWGVLVGADFYGSSRFGDRASVQLYSTPDVHEQKVLRVAYERRLDDNGLKIGAAYLTAKAKPGGDIAPLDIATDANVARFDISRPLILRGWGGVTVEGGYELINQTTDVFGSVGLTRDRLRVASFKISGAWRQTTRRAAWSLEYRHGIGASDASQKGEPQLSRSEGDPQAGVWRAMAEIETPVWRRLTLFTHLEGQRSRRPLLAPEEYAVGSLTIGRGYDPGSAFGDSAAAGTVEARWTGLRVRGRVTAQPFAFVDGAEIYNRDTGSRNRWLSSMGAGVRFDFPRRGRLELMYARPIHAPLGFGERTPPARLLVNFTAAWSDLADKAWGRLRKGGRT